MNRSIDRTPQAHRAERSPALAAHSDSEPFAEQLELSCMHPQLVPMRRHGLGYSIHPSADSWRQLPNECGFAGFGLARGMRMLLDVLAGLRALHQTYLNSGVPFAHGEVAPLHFRIDPRGVCRLVPLTLRDSLGQDVALPHAALGYLAPERLMGQPVGARADVFSVGVLLWEALACRRLFDEPNAEAIIERLRRADIEPPNAPAYFSWASPLMPLLSHALSIHPMKRPVDCSELTEVIARVALDRLPTHAALAEFFGKSGLPPSSPSPRALLAPTSARARGSTDAPRKSATFARSSISDAQRLIPVPRDSVNPVAPPMRFTTVRMSAVQLRKNGLFDSNEAAPESSAAPRLAAPPRKASPPPLRQALALPLTLPQLIAHSQEAAPPTPVRPPPLPTRRRPLPPPRLPAAHARLPVLGVAESADFESIDVEPIDAEPVPVAQLAGGQERLVNATTGDVCPPVAQADRAEPNVARKSRQRSPLSLLGWSALAGLLIGVVIAGTFARRSSESASPRAVSRDVTAELQGAPPSATVCTATSINGSDKDVSPADRDATPASKPMVVPSHSPAVPSEPAARRPTGSAARTSLGTRDYGI